MKPTILLVDDDEAFTMLVNVAIRKSGVDADLRIARDGEEAVSYLSRQGKFSDETAFHVPSLVLLDLKMPRMDGFEVLEWRLDHPELNAMPFVILSSSDLESDRQRASELGAHGYLVKPMDLPGFAELVESLDKFWANVAR